MQPRQLGRGACRRPSSFRSRTGRSGASSWGWTRRGRGGPAAGGAAGGAPPEVAAAKLPAAVREGAQRREFLELEETAGRGPVAA
jgi:hypothetical protein